MAAKSLLSKDQDTTDCYKKTTIKNTTRSKPIINLNEHLYVVGFNSSRQLGFTSKKHITELTKWNNKMNIKSIHCSANVTAYLSCIGKLYISGYGGGTNESAHMSELQLGRRDIYNNMNNININKICASVPGRCIFCITNNNKLYGNGYNGQYQLGCSENDNIIEPIFIENMADVFDVQCSYTFSIAICNSSKYHSIIINFWIKQISIIIPTEIINLLQIFANSYDCFGTGQIDCIHTNISDTDMIAGMTKKWSKISVFNDIQIINIATGYNHALFVESNGNLWSCGGNSYGQLGTGKLLENSYRASVPIKIKYFEINKIKILNIKCGWYHCLVTDINYKIYSFGRNDDGQCGLGSYGSNAHIHEPKLIETLSKYNIINIDCGAWHSYAMNDKKKHYLFGDNAKNQCGLIEGSDVDNNTAISIPFCINDIFAEITNNKTIKSVHLTRHSTIIIATK
eukprot:297642_1